MFNFNSKQQEPKRAARTRLNVLATAPLPSDIRNVMTEAQTNGVIAELPIQAASGQMFLLSCESDLVTGEPSWIMYEGAEGTKQLWNFVKSDMDLICDMVNMSLLESRPQQTFGQPYGSFGEPYGAAASYQQQSNPFPAPETSEAPAAPPVAAAPTPPKVHTMSEFVQTLEKNPRITVAEIPFLAGVPANCADSAMRLQEMVCRNEISEKLAIEALKLAAQSGNGVVDEGILGQLRSRSNAAAEVGRAAAGLLRDAGLVTEADVSAAEAKALSENKPVTELLISTGKTDQLMVDAACKCLELVSEGKIATHQAIIALNYCQRARAPISQAFEDLSINV